MRLSITRYSALVIIDMQRDFCSGGALPVPGCDDIVPKINEYVSIFRSRGLPIIASRDWHPQNHISFKSRGGPWPPHCIQGTRGAEFHPLLKLPQNTIVISKAYLPDREAYSAFDGTELHYILSLKKIRRLFITGVATEYCVKETVLDALSLGYEVIILIDAIAGVNEVDAKNALNEMIINGAIAAVANDIIK